MLNTSTIVLGVAPGHQLKIHAKDLLLFDAAGPTFASNEAVIAVFCLKGLNPIN